MDWLQLPYLETLGLITAGGSPAHYHRRQPNIPYHTEKALTLNWRLHWGVGKQTGTKEKKTEPLANNATQVQDDTEYECRTLTSRIQADNASPRAT